jgi:TatD DNase family protein
MGLIDTHAHIHMDEFRDDLDGVLARAHEAGVEGIFCVGVDEVDSGQALAVARAYNNVLAIVGLHPNEADRGYEALEEVARLVELDRDNIIGIGECGLDYYREGYDIDAQERALRFQIELALEHDLPLAFHVRDAFTDFFRIFDDYDGIRGVVHCFTAGVEEMEAATKRGLYVALNGIMTFTKEETQLHAARVLPLDRLLLETDCPFLTPSPKRGSRNEPANVALTADFLAQLRGESIHELSAATTRNARELFRLP